MVPEGDPTYNGFWSILPSHVGTWSLQGFRGAIGESFRACRFQTPPTRPVGTLQETTTSKLLSPKRGFDQSGLLNAALERCPSLYDSHMGGLQKMGANPGILSFWLHMWCP